MKILFPEKILSLFCLFFFINCSNSDIKETRTNNKIIKSKKDYVHLQQPTKYTFIKMGDLLNIELLSNDSLKFDSVVCIINNENTIFNDQQSTRFKAQIKIPFLKTGNTVLKCISYLNDTIKETDYTEITILSDIEPENLTYKIINTYDHDINAFTQGLVYEDGWIYEGTGDWGKSKLIKYLPENQKKEKEIYLPSNLFGEGIEIYDDKIIQLTWKAQKGFIYNKETFEQIQEFQYPYYEGWGVTYNGENIIMSDGSNKLYFLDKQFLSEIKRIEVYDNIGSVNRLNELEFVNDRIYANILGQNYIVCIEPVTGKVLKKIDLSNILSFKDRNNNIGVLNGIAYNPDKDSFFVTGKNWPKIFEVKFVEKNKHGHING